VGLPAQASAAPPDSFPASIALPNGWQPEGIALGQGTTVFAGSIATGAIYQADLRTGQGSVLVGPEAGRAAVGLQFDPRTRLLFVAGGPTGKIFIYDSATGASVAAIGATADTNAFVNDAAVTRDAVYFTDSYRPFIYRVALSVGGRLPANPVAQEIALGGDYSSIAGQFNANGIVAVPGTQQLIIVNSVLGTLYLVDRASGYAQLIDLGGSSVVNGDGLLLTGHDLYVVKNFDNQIAVVHLDWCYGSGTVQRTIVDPRFDFPTTLIGFGRALYVVNARIPTPATPDLQYAILRVGKGS
jgi:sugar lactone lactonase YvrE